MSSSKVWIGVSRGSDIFTELAVGKPNSIDSADYYGNLGMSDLMIWKTELTKDEVLHSYEISSKLCSLLSSFSSSSSSSYHRHHRHRHHRHHHRHHHHHYRHHRRRRRRRHHHIIIAFFF